MTYRNKYTLTKKIEALKSRVNTNMVIIQGNIFDIIEHNIWNILSVVSKNTKKIYPI